MRARLSELIERALKSRHAEWVLGAISFLESSMVPIVTDPFQVMLTLARPHAWLRIALITIVTSVLGGVAGYFIGVFFFSFFGEYVISTFSLETAFEKATLLMGEEVFLATLIGALTPIPYKLVAVAGGVLGAPLLPFIIASFIGRGIRFLLVGFVAQACGTHVLDRWMRGINSTIIILLLGALLYVLFVIV